jgi:G:T-mismatch repair DNA endonuclease (very short patch repair protein)
MADALNIKTVFDSGKSVLFIKDKYGLSYKTTQNLLNSLGCDTSIKRGCNLEETKRKREETLLERFGEKNASKSSLVKKKKAETFFSNYGVDNIFKAKSFKEHLNKFMLSKYNRLRNNGWHNASDDEKERLWRTLNRNFVSKIEKRIVSILVEMGIQFTHTFFVGGKSFDIKCGNFLIEVNGDFWHANPKTFKPNDLLNFPGKKMLASDIWKRDLEKKKIANDAGFEVVYLWETDIRSLSDKDISERLRFLHEDKKYKES